MIKSKQILAGLVLGFVSIFFMSAQAAEITPYGAFNYKFSHDENSSGVAYNKLEDKYKFNPNKWGNLVYQKKPN